MSGKVLGLVRLIVLHARAARAAAQTAAFDPRDRARIPRDECAVRLGRAGAADAMPVRRHRPDRQREPRVVVVLDWQLSTLGHPMAAFAHHALAWEAQTGAEGFGQRVREFGQTPN